MKSSVRYILFLLLQFVVIFEVIATDKCYPIEYISIHGATKLPYKQVVKLQNKYQKRCLKREDIQELHKVIFNIYLQQGYVTTRALIPHQNLYSRKLIIKVEEGIIEDIEFSNKKKKINNILPLMKNQVLNLRDIEQFLDNTNSNTSHKDVNLVLKPGKRKGSSVIAVDNNNLHNIRFSSGIDNNGSKTKGQNQTFSNLGLANIFGLNESISLGYRTSLGDKDKKLMNSYNTKFELPYGYTKFALQINNANYRRYIQTPRFKYQNKGSSKVSKITVDQLAYRDNSSKFFLTTSACQETYANYIGGNKIDISSYNIHKLEFGTRYQGRLGSSIVGLGMNYTTGENQHYFANFSNIRTPANKFQKLNYNMLWLKPFDTLFSQSMSFKYQLQLLGQTTSDLLVISEKETVGGLASVRGFKDYVENAEKTLVIRNELIADWPAASSKVGRLFWGKVSNFIGFDLGKFESFEEKSKRSGVMTGAAFGIRNSGGMINFNITVAIPLDAPVKVKQEPVYYLSCSVDL